MGTQQSFLYTHNNQTGEEGKGKFFPFLLLLLCLILTLYPNFLFVLAVSNKIREEGNSKFVRLSFIPKLFDSDFIF